MQLARAALNALGHQHALAAPIGSTLTRLFSTSSSAAAEQHHTTPEALREFRENVREFAQTVVAPHAEHVDRSNNFPTDVDLWRQMGEFGLLGEWIPPCCEGHFTSMQMPMRVATINEHVTLPCTATACRVNCEYTADRQATAACCWRCRCDCPRRVWWPRHGLPGTLHSHGGRPLSTTIIREPVADVEVGFVRRQTLLLGGLG
jgi:hypothetical protein